MLEVIDTHCHFAAAPAAGEQAVRQARNAGLAQALVCATHAGDVANVHRYAHRHGFHYAIGLHPHLITPGMSLCSEIKRFEDLLADKLGDPLLAAVGEIGLEGDARACSLPLPDQRTLFEAMLAAAQSAGLPVSVHSRKALAEVYAALKPLPVTGVLHAFAGSYEQACQFLQLGFKLGFGPTLTYPGSRRIREVFRRLPQQAFVLETDAPYMLTCARRASGQNVCQPVDIFEVLQAAAQIRGTDALSIAQASTRNAREVFAVFAADH